MRDVLSLTLESKFEVKAFSTAGSAIEAIKDDPPDLILLDIGLPDMDGVDALREIKKLQPEALVIMVTASTDINTAISTMKLGASDWLVFETPLIESDCGKKSRPSRRSILRKISRASLEKAMPSRM
jgi:DNA-binding NtrC family response regulator